MYKSLKVGAPATIANVAVGYHVLGFAIDQPNDEIVVKQSATPGLKIIEITGAKGKLSHDIEQNTAGAAAMRLLEHIGETDAPIDMYIRKKVPISYGLGSSAASAAAGVYAVSEMMRTGFSKRELLSFARQGDQTASSDTAAHKISPTLLGGMTLVRDSDTLDVKKLHIPPGMTAAVIVPKGIGRTGEYSHAVLSGLTISDHVRQSANLASFVAGMYTSDLGLLQRSLRDLLVEPLQSKYIPHYQEIKEAAYTEDILGFGISGSGPAMYALCANTLAAENVAAMATKIYHRHKLKVNTFISAINHEGTIRY